MRAHSSRAGEPGHEAMTAKLEGAGVHIVEDSAAIENSCVFSEIDSTPTDIIEVRKPRSRSRACLTPSTKTTVPYLLKYDME